MRLINTFTLEFEEFFDSEIPEYAILSHCWGKDEVSFQGFVRGSRRQTAGYQKIADCCRLAKQHSLDWAWVDTCCIDKTSSAELSEAINSMFRWYEQAAVCYVFLSDFTKGDNAAKFSDCRWFTRGFTLQELLAPTNMIFFDAHLSELGTRESLAARLSQATTIPNVYLTKSGSFRRACIAQRMSWASSRQTSRSEDIAYCLLGLFDVSMPLLYGEGTTRAFTRLQHQIIAQSTDESIFAWTAENGNIPRGLISRSPSEYASCQHIFRLPMITPRPPFNSTDKGVEISAAALMAPDWLTPLLPTRYHSAEVFLDCGAYYTSQRSHSMSIVLQRAQGGDGSWFRTKANEPRVFRTRM